MEHDPGGGSTSTQVPPSQRGQNQPHTGNHPRRRHNRQPRKERLATGPSNGISSLPLGQESRVDQPMPGIVVSQTAPSGTVQTGPALVPSDVNPNPHSHPRHERKPRNDAKANNTNARGVSPIPSNQAGQGSSSTGGVGNGRRSQQPQRQHQSRRQEARQRFGGQLTTNTNTDDAVPDPPSASSRASPGPSSTSHTSRQTHTPKTTEATDLTTHLINLLKTPPYPDCPICYSAVHPMQPTWSCSVSNVDSNPEGHPNECCWTTFHLKCIKAWAGKSVKETRDAYQARGEDHPGNWRCPNCQSKRTIVPSIYLCFCTSTPSPLPPRLTTPHSCALPCTRPRQHCEHPCPMLCHPGPCPPCSVTVTVSCWCGGEVKNVRCSNLGKDAKGGHGGDRSVSCGRTCSRPLSCGDPNHTCEEICHPSHGPSSTSLCRPCNVVCEVPCFCGRNSRTIQGKCGDPSIMAGYGCGETCARTFACGAHTCEERCHPHSRSSSSDDINPHEKDSEGEAGQCPFDPSVLVTCPCGTTCLDPGSRKKCTDPIPTCNAVCAKKYGDCEHKCLQNCHIGPCPPCPVETSRTCRCSAVTQLIPCYLFSSTKEELTCQNSCPALRSCGRHQCRRLCCPAASLHVSGPGAKGKGKRKKMVTGNGWQEELERLERDALEKEWHTCDIVCGKTLNCGKHICEEQDHKGVCPPCLRSSFDELVCYCGQTVLLPPIPCGTVLTCPLPCSRPAPICGHSKVPHACHNDDVDCPPCPYLVKTRCMCGKKEVGNVRCSLAQGGKVGCGFVCGRVLECGFHTCERQCHSDSCGNCNAVCGKDRKSCLPNRHPCQLPCHAPSSCDESAPCQAVITLTCSCGRITKPAPCLRSSNSVVSSPSSNSTTPSRELRCNNECAIAQRNAKLADALGISQEVRERVQREISGGGKQVDWSTELKSFAKANGRFVDIVEKAFADFVRGDKKTVILPAMPESKRKFVHSISEYYRLTTQSVDAEPHRSVQLTRRIDSRIPTPLLSSHVNARPSSGLGKLGDLSAPSTTGSVKPSTSTVSASVSSLNRSVWTSGPERGWNNVARPLSSSSSLRAKDTVQNEPPKHLSVATQPLLSNATSSSQSSPVPDDWDTEG